MPAKKIVTQKTPVINTDKNMTEDEIKIVLAAIHGQVWVDMFVLQTDDFDTVARAAAYKATHTGAEWAEKVVWLKGKVK